MQSCRALLVLDFNYKCFYSFCSYEQLAQQAQNRRLNPQLYCMGAYQTRMQPFDVKFPFRLSQGRNVMFQDGYLYMLGLKEIETVLCQYKLIPEQGALVMVSCLSQNSGEDLLGSKCRKIEEVLQKNQFSSIEKIPASRLSSPKNYIKDYFILRVLSQSPGCNIYQVRSPMNEVLKIKQYRSESL